MESDDELEKLKARRDYLREWLCLYKTATDVLPYVQMHLEMTEWEENALSHRPDEGKEIPLAGLSGTFQREYDYLAGALPMMPQYDAKRLLNSTAFSASGTATVYEYISRVGDLGTPKAIEYADEYTGLYRDLQASQDRRQAVRDLIARLNNPQTIERFDRASSAFDAVKVTVGPRTAAALEVRTFLDGIQGDLFDLARQWTKENMTWRTMAERLALGGLDSAEYHEIIRQESKRSSLISRLSEIAKDREAGALTNIENVWAQALDHVYTVLGLVKLA